jgi:hypothetical protein
MGFCAGARAWLIKTQSTQQKLVQLADAAAPDFPECPLHQWYKNKRERQQSTRPGDAVAARPQVRHGENGAVRAVSALAPASDAHSLAVVACLPYLWTGSAFALRCVFPQRRLTAGITMGERTGAVHVRLDCSQCRCPLYGILGCDSAVQRNSI